MKRISGLGLLLCAGMTIQALPAFAGFEFTPPAASSEEALEDVDAAMMGEEAPMPILPPGAVSAEPLAPPASVKTGMAPSSHEPVYIRRQRSMASISPAPMEPVNSKALLEATTNMQPVAATTAGAEEIPAAQNKALTINPYPLDGHAVHNPPMGTVPLEQAMMEQGGALRPVAVPGSNKASSTRTRAQITSRLSNSSQYMGAENRLAMMDPALTGGASSGVSITPIPGGEGKPLRAIESEPLSAPMNAIPSRVSRAMPRPAVPQGQPQPAASSGYADAVGFGRDLPLALAMSQVVPPEYSYAFAQDVNVGSTVSWEGGKPWNVVLDDMLASSGMRAIIQDNQVTIVSL